MRFLFRQPIALREREQKKRGDVSFGRKGEKNGKKIIYFGICDGGTPG